MLSFCLALQIAATAPPESTYSTPALRQFIAAASAANRVVPAALQSYRARVETEIGIVVRRPDGFEGAVAVEQVESELSWQRTGAAEQRVIGYRSRSMGAQISMMSFFSQSWIVPTLYGNRLALLFPRDTARARRDSSRAGRRPAGARVVYGAHPLGIARDLVYRFSGGDTVATLRAPGGEIPIVRVLVEPRDRLERRTIVFHGEMDIDAVHLNVVRLRGRFLSARGNSAGATGGPVRRLGARLIGAAFDVLGFIELENAEVEGSAWIPATQRIELQVAAPFFGDMRSIVRIISRLRDYRLNDSALVARGEGAAADSLAPLPHRITFAPADSISHFQGWHAEIGAATANARADDFVDVSPDAWRPTGAPRLEVRVDDPADLFRFDRIQGAFTGLGARLRLRDAAPGVSLSGTAGWAWSERTARGRASAEWRRGSWIYDARVGRSLDITNDFRFAFDSGATFAALFGSHDDFDYVDRRSATLSAMHLFGRQEGARFHETARAWLAEGVVHDAGATPHLGSGLFTVDSGFRPNRGVVPGTYVRTMATLEYHPNVSGEFLEAGTGALLRYERGDGDLDYQRIEARLVGRRTFGAVSYAMRADGGILLSKAPPPQQLFELGATQGLPGYGYKEFAGDRAGLLHGVAMYSLPAFRAPLKIRRFFLPAPAPALAAGIHAGWAEASDAAAWRSIALLGELARPIPGSPPPVNTLLSRPTDGVRATVDLGLRLFGGSVGIGVARAIDHRAPWRVVLGGGEW